MTCFVGVDVGTTNVKALAMPPDLSTILAHASAPVDTLHPEPGYAEQDPNAIWSAFISVVSEVCQTVQQQGHTVTHVSFCTAMHSLLPMDDTGKPLGNAILWSDNRAEAQATELRTKQGKLGKEIYRETGTPLHPMIPLCKLAWMREHDPRTLHRTSRFGSIKEFLWKRLTGEFEIDFSIATATGLFNESKRQWSEKAVAFAGVRIDQLSTPVPTTQQRSYKPSAETGGTKLPNDVTLIIGASDGCLANLGAGAIKGGVATLTIGTSGAIRQTVRKPLRDPKARLFCYYLDEGYYVVGGPTNNGGNVLEWVSEKLTQQETKVVLDEAGSIDPGADGLLFLPYLQGERAPLWDASVRGAYMHVDWQHTRAHFARAALEGVLLNLLSINSLLTKHTGPARVIHANGGFAQSAMWVQMLADMAGIPVKLNESNESGSMGAILLAMKAVGQVKTLDEAADHVAYGDTYEPDDHRHKLYQNTFRTWQEAQQKI